jgi:hypothetical protein
MKDLRYFNAALFLDRKAVNSGYVSFNNRKTYYSETKLYSASVSLNIFMLIIKSGAMNSL